MCAASLFQAIALAAPGDSDLISARDTHISFPTPASRGGTLPSISVHGRFVAFQSDSTQFISGDTNNQSDIYVRDRTAGVFERVSVSSTGAQSNGGSRSPSISADGRYVAFTSDASNLVPDDSNSVEDVFVHDRSTGTTTRVSGDTSGTTGGHTIDRAISADGRYVAYVSGGASSSARDINSYVYDRLTNVRETVEFQPDPTLVSARIFSPHVSDDGRYIVFAWIGYRYSDNPDSLPDILQRVYLQDRLTHVTKQLDVSSTGMLGNGESGEPTISADGRFAAFTSTATNLTSDGKNGIIDVFVSDRLKGTITRASRALNGAGGIGGSSSDPFLSDDGRYVTFNSLASNLVAGDTNVHVDTFVYDRQTQVTRRTSVSSSGTQANADSFISSISGDGRLIAFASVASNFVANDTNETDDIFVRDMSASSTALVSISTVSSRTASGNSTDGATSASGRHIAFLSYAPDLVPGDTNSSADIFVRDRLNGTMERVSVSSTGVQADAGSSNPAISPDGRYVTFRSRASNLVANSPVDGGLFVHDRQTGAMRLLDVLDDTSPAVFGSFVSADRRYIVFDSEASNLVAGDTNGAFDVFVRDRQMGTTKRVSVSSNGVQGNNTSVGGSISADGRYVVFQSFASTLAANDMSPNLDVFLHDLRAGTTTCISVSPPQSSDSYRPVISANGRFVAFTSFASHLIPDDSNDVRDAFVYDRSTGNTTRISVASSGVQANGDSQVESITADGRYIAFLSDASNLVSNDTNSTSDAFLHDRLTGTTSRVSANARGEQGNGPSRLTAMSSDGRSLVFASDATNFVANDRNDAGDVFVQQRRDVVAIRINVGGAGFTDSRGHFWMPERGFNTGIVSAFTSAVANTTDDVLYQTERWDQNTQPELQYTFPVPSGVYVVRLHFAENYVRNFGVGRRVFDVDMEGVRRFNNIDIFAEVGARAALVKSAMVNVTDGQLNILFHHQTQNPIIDAIEVIGE